MTPLTVKHFADKYGVSEGKVRYTWIEKFGLPTCCHGERGLRIIEEIGDEWYIRTFGDKGHNLQQVERLYKVN